MNSKLSEAPQKQNPMQDYRGFWIISLNDNRGRQQEPMGKAQSLPREKFNRPMSELKIFIEGGSYFW